MTEAELTSQILTMTELFFTGISVVFSVVSAYIVGLYWFLRKAGWLMKLIGFSFFSLVIALLVVAGFGATRHAHGLNLALVDLGEKVNLSSLGSMAIEQTAQGVYNLTASGLALMSLLIYFGLAYLTFFYKWSD